MELVTPDRSIAFELGATNFSVHLKHLYRAGVTLTPDVRLASVRPKGNGLEAELQNVYSGETSRRTVDQVVVEHWLASLMAHNARRGAAQDAAHCLRRFGTTDPGAVAAGWRALWEAHHRRVRAEIGPARLLVFDIESDPPERLCDFAGLDRACARHWRLENPSPSPVAAAFLELLPRPVKRAVPDRIKLPVKRLLRARR